MFKPEQYAISTLGKHLVSALVLIGFIALALGSNTGDGVTNASTEEKAAMDLQVQSSPAEQTFSIKDFKKDLTATWKKNPMKAKLKYEGKVVEVSGKMGSRITDYDGHFTHFELRGAQSDWAFCTPRAEELNGFAAIPMGTDMRLKCMLKTISVCVQGQPLCPGDDDLSTERVPESVGFFGCTRVDEKITPSAAPDGKGKVLSQFDMLRSEPSTETLTAKKLAKILKKNLDKFDNDYRDKVITLSGKIKSIEFSGGSDVGKSEVVRADLVVFRGLSDGIYCNFEPSKAQRTHLAEFETGKVVTVKARVGIANDKSLLFATCIAGQ